MCMEEWPDEAPLQPPGRLIGILYNLKKGIQQETPDAEAEYDSIDTVYAIRDALQAAGLRTVLLEVDASLSQRLREERIDLAFNIAEGTQGRGREAQIPALLNLLGIPFTGSDETALCLALDKALAKRLLATYHVRTPRYTLIAPGATPSCRGLRFPLIIKPNAEGSSKGIADHCVARNEEEFRALVQHGGALYGQAMLAEEFIRGREFTVGILGNGEQTHVFAPMEICFKQGTGQEYCVYNYTVKQDYPHYVDYQCPAVLDEATEQTMKRTARKVFDALGCRDFARVDFRLDESGQLYFIEINPLPGLAPGYSDYPMLAAFCGMPYDQLILSIARTGAARHGIALQTEASV